MVDDFLFWPALAGGMLIGLAAFLFYFLEGRIAGISGVIGSVFGASGKELGWRVAFLAAIVLGALAVRAVGAAEAPVFVASPVMTVVAGLLVGFGTRLGSGCTSGHGVCGLARLSRRSLVAVLVFMVTAMITVAITSLVDGGSV